jgi:threonine/homoserine/homoserine lactone efflux protein
MHELPRPANARAAGFLATRPRWVAVQRRVMGTILAGLALRLALDARR